MKYDCFVDCSLVPTINPWCVVKTICLCSATQCAHPLVSMQPGTISKQTTLSSKLIGLRPVEWAHLPATLPNTFPLNRCKQNSSPFSMNTIRASRNPRWHQPSKPYSPTLPGLASTSNRCTIGSNNKTPKMLEPNVVLRVCSVGSAWPVHTRNAPSFKFELSLFVIFAVEHRNTFWPIHHCSLLDNHHRVQIQSKQIFFKFKFVLYVDKLKLQILFHVQGVWFSYVFSQKSTYFFCAVHWMETFHQVASNVNVAPIETIAKLHVHGGQ